MTPEPPAAMALLTAAALLVATGVFLWRAEATLGRAFRHRETYAENLRRAGRTGEADRAEARTRAGARWLPLAGKALALLGAGLAVAGLLLLP